MASLLLGLASLLPLTIAQTTGTFNTLSFNVAGLPEILNGNDVPGDKTANTARIGQLFAQYNMSLIHVQEDFNYHATLYANDNHPYRTATSGGVPFGSGLNSLSNYNWVDFERIKWNTCSNTDSADCLTPKGFTFMRVKFAEGVWIDAINLHADAGTTDADLVARAANLQQVSDFVVANSKGNPVLIFGDTNTRYTRSGDNPRLFGTANGMTDAWVELIKGGTPPAAGSDALVCENPSTTTACETVDKIWYRGSPALSLKATKFQYASSMFLQTDGNILSDHNPVLVDFAWSLNSQWGVADPFGGEYGTWFNDIDTLSSVGSPKVSSITLRGGSRVDAVSFTLSTGATLSHGGTGGTAVTLKLNDGETIKSARLCRGERSGKLRVFSLKLTTSASRTVSTGVETSDCVEKTAASGYNIVGFLGRDGDEVDKLGFIFGKA